MRFALLSVFAACLAGAAAAQTEPAAPAPRSVDFLCDFRGEGNLAYFLAQQNDYQEDRFVTEALVELDFGLVSWADRRWTFRSRFALLTGMGQSVAENLPFSPKEMAYDINPYVEYRTETLLADFGWLHACQHLIYKDHTSPWYLEDGLDLPPDVYYNRLYAGLGRPEARREILWQTFFGPDSAARKPRWIWHAEVGGYLRSLGSFMDEESLSGGQDWSADLKADVMLPLLVRPAFALFAANRAHLLLDTDNETFWRDRLELEAFFASHAYGFSTFLAWNAVDEHPRDSREDLVEFGGRFFF